MMQYLDKLFSYEFFAPILFGVIGVLIILFLIILFFGKKEQKEREMVETKKIELANINAFAEEKTEPFDVFAAEKESTLVAEEPKINSESLIEPQVVQFEIAEKKPVLESFPEPVIIEPSVNEQPIKYHLPEFEPELVKLEESQKREETELRKEPGIGEDTTPKFNFDDLAASISKELAEIENMQKPREEETKAEENEIFKAREVINNIPVTPISDVARNNSKPVFSSVYVDNASVETAKEEKEPATREQPILNPIETTPIAPVIDLPKPAEMPKLKEENNIFEVPKTNFPDLGKITGESYTIEK